MALTLSLKHCPLCYWCYSLLALVEGIFRAENQPYCRVKHLHASTWGMIRRAKFPSWPFEMDLLTVGQWKKTEAYY